ncbi:MAG: tetratricopeptide repeat protein [Kiritimatiellae bacterium]|nr:tetratricopeptide repeat protein [Kiritimatiellia bacterium]
MSDNTQQAPQATPPDRGDAFKKTSGWARPRAMARDSNVAAWLALVGFICLCIALWGPLSRVYWKVRNRPIEKMQEELVRNSSCFLAVSYEGVSRLPDPSGRYISAEAFRTHIQALRNAGYHPIGLEDVRAFYYDHRLLPEKAILVTFENTRKSTYFETRPILEELDWHAVMGVITKKVGAWENDVILRPYLTSMALDARWDLACESHAGTEFIPVSPDGSKALFFSSPMWLAGETRFERADEFKKRIEDDHLAALQEFEGKLKTKPLAFFFPLGNYGQFAQSGRVTRDANLAAVERHYPLGFILNNQTLNEASTDCRRLNRATIPPKMSAKQLIATLDCAWPFQSAEGFGAKPVEIIRWVEDWGLLEREEEAFTLRATPPQDQRLSDDGATIGARAWLQGSSQFTDGTFETRFELIRGEYHVYLRYRSDDDWVKVAVTEGGRATVGQCLPGEPPEILASDSARSDMDFRSAHNLFITLRGDLVYVRLDNDLLFKGPVRLAHQPDGNIAPGLIGISVQGNDPGLAQSHIRECIVRPRIDGAISWPASISREPSYIVRQLQDSAFRYTVISPPWLDIHPTAPLAFPSIDAATLRIIADANKSRVYPTLALHAEASLPGNTKSEIVRQLQDEGADGVLVDASDFPVDRLPVLKGWLDEIDVLLTARKLGLAVRFPPTVSHLASVAATFNLGPDHFLVTDDAAPPPGADRRYILTKIDIPPPTSEENVALVFQLADYANTEVDALPEFESLRRKGLKAYAEGEYASATNFFSRWRDLDPSNPEAWTLLGNAFARLPDADAAIRTYKVALRLNPGQIDLMIECARLLETTGRGEQASELIDTYARAFPEDSKIAIAQAGWLERHGKRSAGRDILSSLIARHGNDINSRLALHNMLDTPADRYLNMHALLKIGAGGGPSRLLGFGHDIASSEILTMPESSVFFDFIRETAEGGPTEAIRALYADFLPLGAPITEHFDASRLSENWDARGTTIAAIAGTYNLQAASDMAEAYLRLRKSELIRDGYVEVHLGESVGAFWLYARRSSQAMIRFGFNDDGYIRIQSWKNGEIRTGDSSSWIRPSGDIVLRLEVRGDGAMGYVDGRPMFTAPLMVPRDIAYGWWSIAPYSPELGSARARIGLISAGPLQPGLVLMREYKPEKVANALDTLRGKIRYVSALAPVLFEQAPDGTVLSTPLADFMPFRMFCSYHRIRLMPAVSLDYYSDVNAETLVKIILEHNLSGLVLLVRTMPDEDWFAKTTRLLEATSANLIVVQREAPVFSDKPVKPEENVATVREIQRGSLLLQPGESSWGTSIKDFATWHADTSLPSSSPHVVLLATQPVIGDDILPPEPDAASATNALPKAEAPVAPPAAPASAPATNALPKAAAPAATNAIPDKASATKPDAK